MGTPALGSAALSPQALSRRWLAEKYAQPGELSAIDVQHRVALALAQAEAPGERQAWARRFLSAMQGGLLPGGRIMASAGVAQGTEQLLNCFVLPAWPTAQARIEVRRTLQSGGGVGLDFSVLPAGVLAAIHALDEQARTLDAGSPTAGRVGRRPARRAAQMAVLSVRHPEIEAFIHAKDDRANRCLSHFNLSVALDDAFMRARHEGEHASVWRQLVHSAWLTGEPGVLFADTLARDDNLGHLERLTATNPCGEQPLPPYGGCCLASVDLTRLVQAPYTGRAHLSWGLLATLVHRGVRLLDNALLLTRWPLPQAAPGGPAAPPGRRIGLGFTGLADALVMLGLHYNSAPARRWAGLLARFMRNSAYRASIRLARERGSFVGFEASAFLQAPHFASRLPEDLQRAIRRHGIRHSHLLSVAPTASISVAFADNVSPGIEPLVDALQHRRWRDPDGQLCEAEVLDPAWRLHAALRGFKAGASEQPPAFLHRGDVTAQQQVAMVGAVAPYVDGGISKTVELPERATPQAVEAALVQAWRLGIKGLTVFRRGSRPAVITGSDPAAFGSGGPGCGCPGCETPARGCR